MPMRLGILRTPSASIDAVLASWRWLLRGSETGDPWARSMFSAVRALGRLGTSVDEETLEDLIEQVEEYVHYDESLEYILRQIPTDIKTLLAK